MNFHKQAKKTEDTKVRCDRCCTAKEARMTSSTRRSTWWVEAKAVPEGGE